MWFSSRTQTALAFSVLALCGFLPTPASGVIRDGGIDPANLGKGDWIYYMSMATNKLGGNVSSVTNEVSLMLWYKSQGIRYIIIKAATDDYLFNGSYSFPQFTANLVNIAHAHGLLIFGYNRSSGQNVPGEIAISDYIFNQGADGFVWDAETEWESSQPWIGDNGPALAWQMCSAVRSNWPNKLLVHAPFPIISYHSSFPYKEFGYWCDAVMPQIYPQNWTGVKSRPSGGINWTDVNWRNWQNNLYSLPPTNINGLTVYWTNAIKPLAPVNHVYGPNPPNSGVAHIPDEFVMEFVDCLNADPNCVTAGGYKGASFWRTDLHGAVQWSNIKASTIGNFPGIVSHIVIDDPSATTVGGWTAVRTFYNGSFYGDGSGTDTDSFGTNYLTKAQGTGAAYVEFRPNISVPGDYDVFQWHPWLAAASASVPHVIAHSTGTTTVYANQQTNSGKWSLLGRFNFAAGTNGTIRVLDSVAEPTKVAVVDGLKLVFALPTSVPAAPSGLSALAVSASQIDVTWTDNATNEASFVVARSPTNGGPYSDIATLPANATNCSDMNLLANTTFHYVVRAVNLLGASSNCVPASATTLPLIPEPPSIVVLQPRGFGVLRGQAVSFSVIAAGTPLLKYQWRLNGTDLAGATASVLTIASVQSSDEGWYSVLVTNGYGSALSPNALLVLSPVSAMGDNSFAQTSVPPSATNVIALAAGAWHNLALRADGAVVAWGNNWDGQCDVPAGLNNPVAIAAGGYHSLALNADSNVVAWGANYYGQSTVPVGLGEVAAIAAGAWHSLALRTDGTVVGWGDNSFGQTNVPAGLSQVVAIAAGGGHSLALKSNGQVVGWGSTLDPLGNYAGQSAVPLGLSDVVAVAAGGYHSLALRANGSVAAWGYSGQGQTGVPAGVSDVIAVAAGGYHSLALKRDRSIVAWGDNTHGQTTVLPGLADVVAIAAGEFHTLALVGGSPVIAHPPNRQLVCRGDDATFSVTATGLPLPAYQWRFNGTPIAGATGSRYTQANVQCADAGNYDVVVTNEFSSVTSQVAALTMVSPPAILSLPAAQTVSAGQAATFGVVATNDCGDPLTYQWRLQSADIPGATGSTYSRTNAQLSDAGNYSVVVGTGCGSTTSSNASLTVFNFGITIVPSGITVIVSGASGSASGTYHVLTSTNVAAPLMNWLAIATNVFDGSGSFTFTNRVEPDSPQRFFRLQLPQP